MREKSSTTFTLQATHLVVNDLENYFPTTFEILQYPMPKKKQNYLKMLVI